MKYMNVTTSARKLILFMRSFNWVIVFIMTMIMSSTFVSAQVTNPRKNIPSAGAIGDPYIFKFKGKFYLYSSVGPNSPGIGVWSSWDLATWVYEGLCATDATISNDGYAPEVIYYNSTFYMYISPGGNGHYILSGDSPTGPFTVRTGNIGHSIDGSVFTEDNGNLYFTHADGSGILGNTMNSPLTIDGPETGLNAYLNGWTEGSTIFKRNGVYYITYTGNHGQSPGYRIAYGTGTAPFGQYTKPKNSLVVVSTNSDENFKGLGHSTSFIGPDLDTWYIGYHNLDNNGGTRYLNIDPHGFNGSKLVVYGPTNWAQPSPLLPTFYDRFDRAAIGATWTNVGGGVWGMFNNELMWQNTTGTAVWYRQISTQVSGSEYTAEFNMKEVARGGNDGRFGAVFSYVDENNFGSAVLNSFNNTLEVRSTISGTTTLLQSIGLLAGSQYAKWHTLRVEKHNNIFKVFVDNMLKFNQVINGLNGGKIGVNTFNSHADFGYTAFHNQSDGSGIFNFQKPIPGTIEAVHFNAGANGVAYNDLSGGNAGGQYRTGDVDIRNCPEGGYNVGWNATGEWYNYSVNVKSAGKYHLGFRYSTTYTTSKVRFLCDGVDISGTVSLPATGGWDNWTTKMIEGVTLPAGYHTLRVETVEGEFDFYTIQFETAADVVSLTDGFDNGFVNWNYQDGGWSIASSNASINGWGKMLAGNAGWTNYSVEADIQIPSRNTAGLIFRVHNPSNGGANNDPAAGTDFYQGYYVGVQSNGILLGKQNYNWTQLAFQATPLTVGQSYKLRASMYGNTIKIFLNDMVTPVITYIDSDPFLCGKAGFRAFDAPVSYDNFKINGYTSTTGVVTVYKDCNYTGFSSGLEIGDYTLDQLKATGTLDNDISSLKIMQGYKAIIYDGDNFTGSSLVVTADMACNIPWNDITTSIQIRANGDPNVSGTYYLKNRNSSLYADVFGISTADGANISQGTFNGGTNQRFQLQHLVDGTYKVIAMHSSKAMEVEGSKKNSGANVQQWTYLGTNGQQFILVSTGDGYYKLIAKHSGKVVEVINASFANGANIQQWDNNNQTCGQWQLQAVGAGRPALAVEPSVTSSEVSGISISPNPVKSRLYVNGIHDLKTVMNLEVCNSIGQRLLASTGTFIDVDALNEGVYFLKIKSKEISCTYKFIKQ